MVYRSFCHTGEPCKNSWTDRDAVWVEDSGGTKESCIRLGAHWHHLANTTEPSICGGDAAAFLSNYFDQLLLLILSCVHPSNVQKKKIRRCEDPPPKETVLDPVYRYHTSVIADPFEILGIEKPAVNTTVRPLYIFGHLYFASSAGIRIIITNVSVCLHVCPLACLEDRTSKTSWNFLYVLGLIMALAWSSSYDSAMRYVLLVLWPHNGPYGAWLIRRILKCTPPPMPRRVLIRWVLVQSNYS